MIGAEQLHELVEQEKLLLLGVVSLEADHESFERYQQWLADGMSAEMAYMARYQELRQNPQLLLPDATHAIILGAPYRTKRETSSASARIASYARLPDYHRWLKARIQSLADRIATQIGVLVHQRVLVDTAPILERSLAARAGFGFVGKNTCYIHPEYGSFLFLGELLTNAPVMAASVDRGAAGNWGCGTCKRCQVHCPTGALDEPYKLDARKCISYWTIEHRGEVPFEFWPCFTRHLYGCDICQSVCPYNRLEETWPHIPKPRLAETINLYDVATMNQEYYLRTFAGTSMVRAKRAGLRRNALIAMTVLKHPQLAEAMLLIGPDDESVLLKTKNQIIQWVKDHQHDFSR